MHQRLKFQTIACIQKQKKNKHYVNNYRLISIFFYLLKNTGKKILNRKIQNYLLSENIISESQFGFQQNKSTEDAFIKCVNNTFSALSTCNVSLGIFIGFSNAFEIIDHKILLQNIQNLNFSV